MPTTAVYPNQGIIETEYDSNNQMNFKIFKNENDYRLVGYYHNKKEAQKTITLIKPNKHELCLLSISKCNKYVSVVRNKRIVIIFDIEKREIFSSFTTPKDITATRFTTDLQNFLVGYSDGELNIYQIESKNTIKKESYKLHSSSINCIVGNSIGNVFYSCSNNELKSWDLNGNIRSQIISTTGFINSIALSRNDRYLVYGGGQLRLDEITKPRQKEEIEFENIVCSLLFDNERKVLYVATTSSQIHSFDLSLLKFE